MLFLKYILYRTKQVSYVSFCQKQKYLMFPFFSQNIIFLFLKQNSPFVTRQIASMADTFNLFKYKGSFDSHY